MKDAAPQPTLLADYQPFPLKLHEVALTFRLAPSATRVLARLDCGRAPGASGPVRLDGEGLKLLRLAIDGRTLGEDDYSRDSGGLTLTCALPERFTLESEVEIDPASNTALEGLYMSNGMYCSQCEAEGFRKITYYPDRPDVMARFRVRIESDLPVLLSNGNPVASGPGWAEWDDPWPKPSYLFALVAGDLVAHSGGFTTRSGRDVALNIWVRRGDEDKCAYALDALKRSMAWDETAYGREYDLDVFNIVAVDDFNMGAMENKGLNIFNSKFVLASPETATDRDFELIEGIIAHEYFHNWTGNRITCRDWFQLCLKEGLTVFRDQQFSADMRSAAVQRIEDVLQLRARQFREDNGPLAHPVRPDRYVEINNFYTATVYEKGAEVIGMLKRLVGDDAYRRALDLYFQRHDGEAATIEDWLNVFEDATGRDLSQFKRWYTQAGTPRLHVSEDWRDGTYTLVLRQETPPTPGQPVKEPQVIPVAVGLLNPNGDQVVPTTVLELDTDQKAFRFDGLAARPVPSILRSFSAPVILTRQADAAERAFLLAHDTDPFNRWEAGRALAKDVVAKMVRDGAAADPAFGDALARVLRDDALDPAFRALVLRLPSEDDMAQTLYDSGITPDPLAIHQALERLRVALAERMAPELPRVYAAMEVPGRYSPEAGAAGRRALRLASLSYLARLDMGAEAARLMDQAQNMTDEVGALQVLLSIGRGASAADAFYRKWRHNRLVIDKWFALQVAEAAPPAAARMAGGLLAHPDFDWKNPNRVRSVLGALPMNAAGFHDPTGASYRLMADALIRLDRINPQTTARLSGAFETWRRYDADRQGLIRGELERILAVPGLSRDMTEMVGRMLNG